MKKIKNIYSYYAIHFMVIALGIYLATFSGDGWIISLSVLVSIIYCAVVFGLFIKKIPVNKATALVDRRNGSLYPQHLSNGYWLTWGLFKNGEISKLLDATMNPYTVTAIGQSSDSQKIVIKATMNTRLESAYRHLKYITKDEDDVKQAILEDFGNTVRNMINRFSADQLLAKENISGKEIERQIEKETDSLKETLKRVGYSYNDAYFTIDEVTPTEDYVKANAELEQARRVAKRLEFENAETSKLVDTIVIKQLLGKITPKISLAELKKKALEKLNWTEKEAEESHESEATLYDEMLITAANLGNVSPEKLEDLQDKAEEKLNIRTKRVIAYSGLNGAKPIVQTSNGQN